MNLRKKAAMVTAAALAIGGAATAFSPAAYAATNSPSCINRYVTGTTNGFDVMLTNKCGKTMRAKVIVNNGGDSPCYTMAAGSTALFHYVGVFGTYERTVGC